MITVSDTRVFALSNVQFSYVFRASEEGLLEHIYYGAPLSEPLECQSRFIRREQGCTVDFEGIPHLNLNSMPQEFPTLGRGDYRSPIFQGRNSDGNSVFDFRYKGHEIIDGKPDLSPLPSARGDGAKTLIITLRDALYNLEAKLHYTIYPDSGVLARSVQLINSGDAPLIINQLASLSLDLPAREYDLLHLHGTWAREMNAERTPLPQARVTIESNRGTSSAAHMPFLAVMEQAATEERGEVFAATLLYSGNHQFTAERGEFGEARITAGINPQGFHWTLQPGESFQSPEALLCYSAEGLRGMSHHWHNFIRARIGPPQFKHAVRPTYLNSWEAAYFDINEDKVLSLADKAKEIGAEMIVVDDGWFKGRNDPTSSLGDWTADVARFASGIPALAKRVKEKGLEFGLWLEPEMVSPNSDLYRAHPDWALQVPGRKASLGRNQLTLDLSNSDVVEHLFGVIDALLSCGNIDYIKWDMNRHMSEVGSPAWPAEQQGEIAHRYMLGLYELLARLTEKYPHVLFENCASGGNRFDLGMLSFMAQGWVSDMVDPMGRREIITGASYLFPMDMLTAYIGPSPNHQNGRESSLNARYLAGFLCAGNGVSLSAEDIAADQEALAAFMARSKETREHMMGGRFYRLRHTGTETIWQIVSADGSQSYVIYFMSIAAPNMAFSQIKLAGLQADQQYEIEGRLITGNELMQRGLRLPPPAKGDFQVMLFTLTRQ